MSSFKVHFSLISFSSSLFDADNVVPVSICIQVKESMLLHLLKNMVFNDVTSLKQLLRHRKPFKTSLKHC